MRRREVVGLGQPVNYALLSLFQYIASVLVIMVHCQRLFEHEALHFVQKSMFGRMAVPFFLISFIASAAFILFIVILTSWQPAFSNSFICFTVASTSAEFVLVID